jgi:ribosome-associated translation inhibitor RaiA
MTAT